MRKAFDCETTGLDLMYGCKPFFVSISYEDGTVRFWEWPVDPHTRQPMIPVADIEELYAELTNPCDRLVGHNSKFDVRAIQTIIPRLPTDNLFARLDDTLLMSHALDSHESHGLKDLALKYANIKDTDESDLKTACDEARAMARKLKWRVANKESMPLQKSGKNWWKMDMFLPRAIADFYGWPDEHPWRKLLGRYANMDTARTLVLDTIFREALETQGLTEQYEKRRKLLPVVYNMEQRGVTLDCGKVDDEIQRCLSEAERYRQQAAALAENPDLNVNSDAQIRTVLIDQLDMPVLKQTDSGAPSVDKDVLTDYLKMTEPEDTAYQFCVNVVASKKFTKAAGSLDGYKRAAVVLHPYVSDPLNNFWRLFPNFNITGTATTRFSSSNPNAQNISKGKEAFIEELKAADLSLRKCFGPAPWREWYAIDYVQLQLVIFAHVSEEASMIEAVQRGMDFHTFMAQRIFGLPDQQEPDASQRTIAKNVNFGFIFGAGPSKIEQTAKRPGLYDELRQLFPNATKFIDRNKRQVRKYGYVFTAGGYRLTVPGDTPYAATNYIVQGTEGDIVQLAMLKCDAYLREHCPDAYITMNVHDELVFDFPRGEGIEHIGPLAYLMEEAGRELQQPINCTVDAKYIPNHWAKGETVEFGVAA